MFVRAEVPATMGEWVQGWIDGRECLVSLVVKWRGFVTLCDEGTQLSAGRKALRAFESAKRHFCGRDMSACSVDVSNPYPVSRGFATSTMDIAGVFAACAAYAGERISDEELFSLCVGIEPSDGIMFDGLAFVDHLNGELIERLPPPPEMEMVVLVPEAMLDTMDYRLNERVVSAVRQLSKESESAYLHLRRGLISGDVRTVAEAASMSAALQQMVIPKPEWDLLLSAKESFCALGVAAAHSGTASALLFDPRDEGLAAEAEIWLKKELEPCGAEIMRASVSGGGICVNSSLC